MRCCSASTHWPLACTQTPSQNHAHQNTLIALCSPKYPHSNKHLLKVAVVRVPGQRVALPHGHGPDLGPVGFPNIHLPREEPVMPWEAQVPSCGAGSGGCRVRPRLLRFSSPGAETAAAPGAAVCAGFGFIHEAPQADLARPQHPAFGCDAFRVLSPRSGGAPRAPAASLLPGAAGGRGAGFRAG